MDKIWYRNASKSEVNGRCDGGGKKRMTTQSRQKSNAKKNKKIKQTNLYTDVYSRSSNLLFCYISDSK